MQNFEGKVFLYSQFINIKGNKMAEAEGEGKREKGILKILEGWLRCIFGFEKVKKREIKEKR